MHRSRVRKLACLTSACWVLFISACTTYHGPQTVPLDPQEAREGLLATLDTLDVGDSIFVELVDGERHRVRYRSHDMNSLTVPRKTTRPETDMSFALMDVVHIERVDIAVMKTLGAGVVGYVGLILLFIGIECLGDCDIMEWD